MSELLNESKEKLNQVSNTFCLVKWKHATINLAVNTVKTCCHNPSRKIDLSVAGGALHDHPLDLEIRSQMLRGERPEACKFCWQMEDTGHYSDRIFWSQKGWMNDFYGEVKDHNSETALSPSWLELNFSSVCNLKCSYCNPGYSTSWQQEVKKFGPYPTSPAHNDLTWFKKNGLVKDQESGEIELADQFWSWFRQRSSSVRLLTITGGEPLLSKGSFDVFDYLIENPHPQLELAINSNLCLPETRWSLFVEKVERLISEKKIAKLFLHPSLDSWGKRAEYIRFGLDLSLFQKNLNSYLEKTQGHVIINCTLNNLSLGGLLDYWKFLIDLKKKHSKDRWVSSTTEPLVEPSWQSVNLLGKEFAHYFEDVEKLMESERAFITDHELEGIRRAKNYLASPLRLEDREYRMQNFYRFFSEHDRRRGTSFSATFPELEDFYNSCKNLVPDQILVPAEVISHS